MSGIPGPGRLMGSLLSSSGRRFESFLDRTVERLGVTGYTLNTTAEMHAAWCARRLRLAMQAAFQFSPYTQSRMFLTLGILATAEVDDDLF